MKELNKSEKFSILGNQDFRGVVLNIGNMEAVVYWYSIPDHWFKKNYDEDTSLDENGDFYEGLDTYFYRKKTHISTETEVRRIKDDEIT